MPRIAYVDDDRFYSASRVEYLRKSIEVEYFREILKFVEYVKRSASLDAVVVDMMMPPPDGIDPSEVDGGLETGMWALSQIDEFVRLYPMPVVFITNTVEEKFVQLEARLVALDYEPGLVQLHRKFDLVLP